MKQNQFEFKPFDKVLVRDLPNRKWGADLFSHLDESRYQCVSSNWDECIPYNEETADLIGTTKPYVYPTEETKHLLNTSLPYEKPVKELKEYHVWSSDSKFNKWFTKTEFENFIKTAVINNKDITDFHVFYVKSNN